MVFLCYRKLANECPDLQKLSINMEDFYHFLGLDEDDEEYDEEREEKDLLIAELESMHITVNVLKPDEDNPYCDFSNSEYDSDESSEDDDDHYNYYSSCCIA